MKKLILLVLLAAALPVFVLAQEEVPENPKEAQKKELISQVETFKKTVSRIRGKDFREDFKVSIKSKEELRKFILEKTEEAEFTEELDKSTKLLVKLGLVKPETDLKKLMIEVMTEQVAGLYDPEEKELCLMEGTMEGPMQEVALAHEIFHALQDQYYSIDSMMKVIRHDDDLALAVNSIIEGEATLGGFEPMFEKQGGSIISIPMDLGQMIRQQARMAQEMQPDSALAKAPAFIRQTLFFRYAEGASFMQAALRKYKSWKELDRVFDNPPMSTEQVMHPQKYFEEIDYPVRIRLPRLHEKLEGDWEETYTSTMGEFEISVLLCEFVGEKIAAVAAEGWDGDSYTMIESKEKGGPQIIGWLSVWDTDKDAQEFAEAYAKALAKRFATDLQKTETGYFVEQEDGEENAAVDCAGAQVLVIQGAPPSVIPKVKSIMVESRQVVMSEQDFGKLAGQKLAVPETPDSEKAEPNKEDAPGK